MHSAYTFFVLLCFCSLHVCLAGNCICSDHNERPIYECDDTNNMPFNTLYYDGLGPNCLVEVSGLHAKQGWKAGIYISADKTYQWITYIKEDAGVIRRPCTESRLPGVFVDSDKSCYPQDAIRLNSVNGGWTTWTAWSTCPVTCGTGTMGRTRTCTNPAPKYNGAKCSGPASESKACGTNHCPVAGGWTTWSAWTTCPVTCGTGSSTRTRACTNPVPRYNGAQCAGHSSDTQVCGTKQCPVPTTYVPVPTVVPSTKCDAARITDHLLQGTSASHSAARLCGQSNTNSESEALLLDTCKTPHTHYRRWLADLKVIDHCSSLRQGDPLGVFINGRVPLQVFAAFWRCKTTSFEIVYQTCGASAMVVDVKNSHFTPETFYTLKW